MNPFEMVVLIVIVVTAGRIIAAKNGIDLRSHRRRFRDRDGFDPQLTSENERMRGEIGQLKERIATLERLAVDKRSRLADEIDALGRNDR